MKEWKYLIGSVDDFIGAPEWATVLSKSESGMLVWDESATITTGCRYQWKTGYEARKYLTQPDNPMVDHIIAQRTESFGNAIDLEFCKAYPDHPDCKCKGGFLDGAFNQTEVEMKEVISSTVKTFFDDTVCSAMTRELVAMALQNSKYNRPCKDITIDVYDVLQAFAVTNPATQHAVKKLLCAGSRGHKDKMQDLTEALKSIERAIELEKA